jgi:hypothetical protein
MLLAFLAALLSLLPQKGLFIDDSMHMPAGYSYLLTHDYRLNQEHPPLIKLLSGLGLWRLHPQFPFDSPGWQQAATPEDPEDGMTRIEEAFFDRNAAQFEQIAFYGRLPVLVIPLLLLLAVWWFTRQLFGPVAALIAVFLLATEPNIAGNSIVVQNDIASALALLLFVIALKKFLTDDGMLGALLLGGALGLALVTKYSLLVLVPVAFAILVIRASWRLIRKRFSVKSEVLLPLVVFGAAYFILIAFYSFGVDIPPLLPRYFVYGVHMVVQDTREGRPAFLLGQVSDTGWWYYFPVAFALKTTIPFLVTSIGGLVWAVIQVFRGKRYVLLYALLPGVLYLGLTMTSHLNIGVRHLLPMFPFVAVTGAALVAALVEAGTRRSRVLGVSCALVLLAPSLAIAISTFPNYLTYFNPLAGGSERGWQKLSDSNVETGQEVKPLARYLQARGENRVTGIMVGGEFLKFYGVELEDFPGWYDDDDPSDPETKYVAIGAWYFSEIDLSDEQKEIIDRYRHQQPEAMVGNSIFVFRR